MSCKSGNFAKNSKQELVHVLEAEKSGEYFCRFCGRRLILNENMKGKKYFSHKKTIYKKGHDFSQHIYLQDTITTLLQKQKIDYRREFTITPKIRADIIFYFQYNNRRRYYVIEIQRTPIRHPELCKRINYYRLKGIGLIWIIPKVLKKYVQMALWEQYLLAYQQNILYYDESKNSYYYIISCLKISPKTFYITYRYVDLSVLCSLRQLINWQGYAQKQVVSQIVFYKELYTWQRKFMRVLKRRDCLVQLLYETQINLVMISHTVYNPYVLFLNYQQSVFWVQTVIYLLVVKLDYSLPDVITFFKREKLLFDETDTSDMKAYSNILKNETISHKR